MKERTRNPNYGAAILDLHPIVDACLDLVARRILIMKNHSHRKSLPAAHSAALRPPITSWDVVLKPLSTLDAFGIAGLRRTARQLLRQ